MPSDTSVGKFFISFGIDASSFSEEMIRAEQVASGSSVKIKEKLASLAGSLGKLRTEAKQVREELAQAPNFDVRGSEALDKLHDSLFKVRDAGATADKTLDELSLKFEAASRGAKTYTQALDKVASDKTAAQTVRDLARALSEEAKEANYSTGQLEKRAAVLNRQINQQNRTFASALRQKKREEEPESHAVPEQAAASALVRGAEGTLSIRAGERFLTSTLGLGPALQAIFPVVGGLAMIDILTGLIGKTEEWYQKLKDFENQPKIIAAAFRDINKPIEIANDELDVTNEKLKGEIAKLEGHPENSLKLALEEARLAADHLGESLKKDFDQLQKLLQEHDVSKFQQLLGNASDSGQLRKELFGNDGYGGVKARAEDISDRASDQLSGLIDRADTAKTKPEKEAINKQANEVRSGARADLTNLFDQEIKSVTERLATRQQLQQTYLRYQGGDDRLRLAAIQQRQVSGIRPDYTLDQAPLIERDRSTLRFLRSQRRSAIGQFEHVDLEEKKQGLETGAATSAIDAPFRNKINELGGELEKLQSSLNAIGQTETAKTLAKAFGEAQLEVVKLNDELAKHHQALSFDQQVQLVTAYDEIESTKAEESFRQKFEQTTNSISERINSLRTLSGAIGQGYEAQKRATVENQVSQEFGTQLQDPAFVASHQPQIAARREQLGKQFDQQQSSQSATSNDKLGTEIEQERTLASVQQAGAGAVRTVTLAYQLRELAENSGLQKTKELIDAEIALAAAEKRAVDLPKLEGQITEQQPAANPQQVNAKTQVLQTIDQSRAQQGNQSSATLAQLQQEIDSTNRLTLAQTQGAEAVRKAQLESRIVEIRRNTVPGEDQNRQVQAVTELSNAQRQQEILSSALQTGNAFRDQLQSINQQIGALEQLRAKQGDSLEIEISLKNLEQQRIQVISQQALVFGSARDGMRAFFAEMATGSESSAMQAHDAFAHAFNSLDDTLARLLSGQKVSWASLLQSISADLAKMSLHNIEAQIAAKWFPPSGQNGTTKQEGGRRGSGILQTIGSLFGGFRASGGPVSSDQWHVVGEEGPEVFIPDSDGTILPNKKLRDLSAFNNRETSSSLSDVSLATKAPGWLAALAGIRLGNNHAPAAKAISNSTTEMDAETGLPLGHDIPGTPDNSSGETKTPGMGKLNWAMLGISSGLGLISMLKNRPKDHHHQAGHAYAIPNFNGAFAAGGDVKGGKTHLVGEKGPELFVPHTDGTIIPNHQLNSVQSFVGPGPGFLGAGMQAAQGATGSKIGMSLLSSTGPLGGAIAGGMTGGAKGAVSGWLGNSGGGAFGAISGGLTGGTKGAVGGFLGGSSGGMLGSAVSGGLSGGFKGMGQGLLGSLPGFGVAHAFGGFRAAGGNVDPGNAYIVGERGPELWAPPASGGQIVPNNLLGASGQVVNNYVDARGTDPAGTEQAIRRANLLTHDSAVKTAFRSYTEYQNRTPQTGK